MRIRRKRLVAEIILASILLALALWFMLPKFLQGQNINTAQNFPDPILKKRIEVLMGAFPGGKFSKRQLNEVVSLIDLANASVKTVKGIEQIPNLLALSCPYNQITEINLSNNTALRLLRLAGNPIIELDVSNNPSLEALDLMDCPLQSLTISKNPNLKQLTLTSKSLPPIDLSQNANLESVILYDMGLQELDIQALSNLQYLNIGNNNLKKLDLSQNTNLNFLHASSNSIESIDVSSNMNLNMLILSHNNLSSIPDLSRLNKLTTLDLRYNNLDCDDWETIQSLKKKLAPPQFNPGGYLISGFAYEPQNQISSFECGENDESENPKPLD